MTNTKKTMITAAMSIAIIVSIGIGYLARIAPSGTGYKAMTACTALFISGRSVDGLDREEFSGLHPILDYVSLSIDTKQQNVSADMFGLGKQKAVFRKGLGCTLIDQNGQLSPPPLRLTDPIEQTAAPWTSAQISDFDETQTARLNGAADRAFAEPDSANRRNTRALLIYHDGALVTERYADGVAIHTELPGYSLTKTILGALIGIAYEDQPDLIDKPTHLKAWQDLPVNDARRRITVSDLLHMTTGTSWSEETGDPLSPVLRMTYHARDMAAFAAAREPKAEPGTNFQYNSGSSLLLSRLLMEKLAGSEADYLAFPRQKLFSPTGMTSAMIAPDAAGTINGGFGATATARDWLRFGILYLNDGMVRNARLLPQGWVRNGYLTQRASEQRGYGRHVWVNRPFVSGANERLPRTRLPDDTMLMNGQFGQMVAVIPSRKVVIVRLGQSNSWDFSADPDRLVADILAALPDNS